MYLGESNCFLLSSCVQAIMVLSLELCGGEEFRGSTIPPRIFTVDGFGEEDDSNTREVSGRELVLVFRYREAQSET